MHLGHPRLHVRRPPILRQLEHGAARRRGRAGAEEIGPLAHGGLLTRRARNALGTATQCTRMNASP
jgi:hypothetical protein